MLKADLRRIIYTPDLDKSVAGKSSTEPFQKLSRNLSRFSGSDFSSSKNIDQQPRNTEHRSKNISLNKNQSSLTFAYYNKRGNDPIIENKMINKSSVPYNLLIPTIGDNADQNRYCKRLYSSEKNKCSIGPSISVTEERQRSTSKRIIQPVVTDEYKKFNEKKICSWERASDSLSKSKNSNKIVNMNKSSLSLGCQTKNKNFDLLLGTYKYKNYRKTGEVKLLIENTIANKEERKRSELKVHNQTNPRSYSAIKSPYY